MISYIFDYILELFCGSVSSKKIEKDGTFKDKPSGFGERQSPINIVTGSVVPTENLPPLSCTYDPASVNVCNTGSSWKMDFTAERTSLSGGPLEGNYKIIQMHAHWGKKGGKGGSEHTIDGKKYDGELHLVHFNTKYRDFSEAVDKPDGLAVLGMFLKAGKAHKELEKICSNLSAVPTKGKSMTKGDDFIDPAKYIPTNKTFFTYPGSLTTPGFQESVSWFVYREPIEVSEAQLDAMRSLKTGEDEECCDCMVDNWRPPCDLKGRTVKVVSASG